MRSQRRSVVAFVALLCSLAVTSVQSQCATMWVTSSTNTGALASLGQTGKQVASAVCRQEAALRGLGVGVTARATALLFSGSSPGGVYDAQTEQIKLVLADNCIANAKNERVFANFEEAIAARDVAQPSGTPSIRMTIFGATVTDRIWTGFQGPSCNNWLTSSAGAQGRATDTSVNNHGWLGTDDVPCNTQARLYCISPPSEDWQVPTTAGPDVTAQPVMTTAGGPVDSATTTKFDPFTLTNFEVTTKPTQTLPWWLRSSTPGGVVSQTTAADNPGTTAGGSPGTTAANPGTTAANNAGTTAASNNGRTTAADGSGGDQIQDKDGDEGVPMTLILAIALGLAFCCVLILLLIICLVMRRRSSSNDTVMVAAHRGGSRGPSRTTSERTIRTVATGTSGAGGGYAYGGGGAGTAGYSGRSRGTSRRSSMRPGHISRSASRRAMPRMPSQRTYAVPPNQYEMVPQNPDATHYQPTQAIGNHSFAVPTPNYGMTGTLHLQRQPRQHYGPMAGAPGRAGPSQYY